MTEPIIKVENLGKLYRIGSARERNKTLRETLVDAAKAPFLRAQEAWRKGSHSQPQAPSSPHAEGISPLSAPSSVPSEGISPLSAPSSMLSPCDDTIWALKDVSFEVKRGEVVGIIGRNGAGKSTLLKILSRITEPTEGRVVLRGRVGSLLEVGTGFHSELTGEENIYLSGTILGMSSREISNKFDEIVSFAEMEKFIHTPVKHYSSGMYMRLAFSVAAHLEPEILLIDEVLAVGDASFQKKCLGKMGDVAKEGRTVLFVSHNMNAIATLCNKAIFLCEGSAKGPFSIMEGINLYLGQSGLNEKTFKGKPLTWAKVQQKNDVIEIVVAYELDSKIKMPNLGFVISDYFGNPICGSNPHIDRQEQLVEPSCKGVVKVIIEHPQLMNGTYRLSLWFDDTKLNFFAEKDCLIFDVLNMVTKRQLPITAVGPVFPKCRWYFQ